MYLTSLNPICDWICKKGLNTCIRFFGFKYNYVTQLQLSTLVTGLSHYSTYKREKSVRTAHSQMKLCQFKVVNSDAPLHKSGHIYKFSTISIVTHECICCVKVAVKRLRAPHNMKPYNKLRNSNVF